MMMLTPMRILLAARGENETRKPAAKLPVAQRIDTPQSVRG
jgi:hypothetical protein